MPTTDERVLKFIGRTGTTAAALAERFPYFDVNRLVRAHLVAISTNDVLETESHGTDARVSRYVLTPRGFEAGGIESRPT